MYTHPEPGPPVRLSLGLSADPLGVIVDRPATFKKIYSKKDDEASHGEGREERV